MLWRLACRLFAFYHKFWHTYMLIFAGTNTVLLSLILFRKKLPMRDMNRRYFYVWLNVITYCMATGNTLQCYCSYNHIFSVLQGQSILTFYKRSLPFSEIGHYCVGVGDRHSDYSVYYVVPVVPYSVLCSVFIYMFNHLFKNLGMKKKTCCCETAC